LLNAVNEGEAPCTIINGLRMNIVTQNPQYEGLSILQLETTDDRAIGVVDGNVQLLLILNRGINFLGENYGINASYKYINDLFTTPFSFYIRKYIAWVMFGVVTIFSIVAVSIIKSTKRAQKLAKEKDEAKTTFLFNMSHDIRTPMNAIMGFTKLLEKNQDDPEKRQDYIEKIEESSEVLLSLINNVLEMSRIEKGTLELDEQAFDAKEFNDTLFTVFDEMMSEKNIEFTREVDITNRYVFFDPIKLREVFFNLLSNAYKYTPEGGKVHMSLREIPYDNEGFALYETKISDTGIGIAEDYLPHIFDEFTRERNSTEAKIEGTGLGMAIVKKLLEAMDGTIEVESKKGEGTTFTVTIPHKIAAEDQVEKVEVVSSDQIDFKGKRILLAEDNDFNAEIAITILSEEGFEVERASNGAECVEMIKKNKAYYYDIVLMDIQMPGMNGYEATKTIRSLDDDRKSMVPIAAMTANAFEEDRRAAYRAGMNAHLSKPIEIDELINVLARCIR